MLFYFDFKNLNPLTLLSVSRKFCTWTCSFFPKLKLSLPPNLFNTLVLLILFVLSHPVYSPLPIHTLSFISHFPYFSIFSCTLFFSLSYSIFSHFKHSLIRIILAEFFSLIFFPPSPTVVSFSLLLLRFFLNLWKNIFLKVIDLKISYFLTYIIFPSIFFRFIFFIFIFFVGYIKMGFFFKIYGVGSSNVIIFFYE